MHYWVPGEEKCMARFTLVEGPSPVMDSGGGAQGFVMYCAAVFFFQNCSSKRRLSIDTTLTNNMIAASIISNALGAVI